MAICKRSKLMCIVWKVVILFLHLHIVTEGFTPKTVTQIKGTQSINTIILDGVHLAAAEYIRINENLPLNDTLSAAEVVREYFGSDIDSYRIYKTVIDSIINKANEIQKLFAYSSSKNVNGEEIQQANSEVYRARKNIMNEFGNKMDHAFILEQIGEALFTLCAFYSNTNWVEMKGATVHEDFGLYSQGISHVATKKEDTCQSCDYSKAAVQAGSCDNNIITNKLTSGYRSGQNNDKPFIRRGIRGKCSHGSSKDYSKERIATGGIYKGMLDPGEAPHFKWHHIAAEAAKKAVKDFLIHNDTGIFKASNNKHFKEIFKLKKKEKVVGSLTFVIDVSGSMGEEIAAVKEQTIKYVTSVGPNNRPKNYVLATFNDPDSLKTVKKTTDGSEMVKWLGDIKVDGGKDCPEYAIGGMILGVQNSEYNSTLFMYTDADAKDADRRSELTKLLKEKSIKPNLMTTGKCNTRRKRHSGSHTRSRRQTLNVFDRIARETGGSVYSVDIKELDQLVEKLISSSLPSSTTILNTWHRIDEEIFDISVDTKIELLKIEIQGFTQEDKVTMYYPDGSVVHFPTKSTTKLAGDNSVVMSVQKPIPGTWKLTVDFGTSCTCQVNITAQSSFDFDVSLMEKGEDGFMYHTNTRPISGNEYMLIVEMLSPDVNSSIGTISLYNDIGESIRIFNSTEIHSSDESTSFVLYNISEETSWVMLEGIDSENFTFTRYKYLELSPVSVILKVATPTDGLSLSEVFHLHFTLTNTGAKTSVFNVSIQDDKNFVQMPLMKSITLGDQESIFDNFTILPTETGILTYSVGVQLQSTKESLQLIKKRVLVTSIIRPSCEVTNVTGTCPPESLNTRNCSSYTWAANTTVFFSDAMLTNILLSNDGSDVILSFDNDTFTLTTGPVQQLVTGTCCSPSVFLNAMDTEGYSTLPSCHIHLANTEDMIFIEEEDITTTHIEIYKEIITETDNTSMVIGVTVGISCVLIIGIVVFIIMNKSKSKREYNIEKSKHFRQLSQRIESIE